MFNKKDKRSNCEKELDHLYEEIKMYNPVGDEQTYQKLLGRIETLERVKNEADRNKPRRPKIDPNTALIIAANLAGMVLIMVEEQYHPITTKAFGTLLRPRL